MSSFVLFSSFFLPFFSHFLVVVCIPRELTRVPSHARSDLLRADQNQPDALYYRGLCLFYLGNHPQAIAHCQSALRNDPDFTLARYVSLLLPPPSPLHLLPLLLDLPAHAKVNFTVLYSVKSNSWINSKTLVTRLSKLVVWKKR